MLFKILAATVFVAGSLTLLGSVCVFLCKAVLGGRLLALKDESTLSRSERRTLHQRNGRLVVCVLIALLVWLEGSLQILGVHATAPGGFPLWYLVVHICCFAAPALILFSLALYFTGERVMWHRYLVYTAITLFAAAIVTGVPMFLWDVWHIVY